MRLPILLAIYSLLLGSCIGAPVRPDLDICSVQVDRKLCLCQIKHSDDSIDPQRKEPLAYCDKATAFAPLEWQKFKNYIDAMKAYIETNCKGMAPSGSAGESQEVVDGPIPGPSPQADPH